MTTTRPLPYLHGFALCALMLALAACRPAPPAPSDVARPAKLLTIQGATAMSAREFPGVIRAFDEAEISFLVAGRIVKLPVKEGQQVQKNDLIAQLDDRDFVSALNAARAQLTLQLTQYDSSSNLYAKGVISRDEFDQKSRDLAVARSDFEQAQKTLDDSALRAPYNGQVARRYAEEGQSIQAKQAIVLLQDISRFKLTVNLPEQLVARGSSGEPLEDVIKRVRASARLPAFPGRTFEVILHEFSTTADPDTRTYAATFVLSAPADALIMPGMTASVSAQPPEAGAAGPLFIPITAIFKAPDGATCLLVVNTNDMTVQRRVVTAGEMSGGDIQISSGLAPGETIVAAGAGELTDGQRVQRYTVQ